MTVEKTTIRAGEIEKQYWRDLWRYRELFYFLAWRDLLVRYKQTSVGIIWALIRPLASIVIFSGVFGKIAKLDSGGVPYPILVCVAQLPWQLFSSALSESGSSLVANSNLISKIYFPRLVIPASALITSLVDFLISLVILVVLMAWYRFVPDWKTAMLPFFVLLALLAVMGAGVWLSALTVKYRDFRIIVPFILQFGQLLSPIGYSSDQIPANWRLLYSLNPMVGVIDGFRWAIFGGMHELYLPGFFLSLLLVTIMLITGIRYFRKTERSFADII
jgi:lipopolysaccharide transport system permease protein